MPLVVLVALLAAMGLIAWFGILPFHTFIREKADGIQEYYAFRENRERQINKLPELQKQFDVISENEHALNILLSQEQIVDLVKTLEGLAEKSGVHIAITSKDGSDIQEKKPVKPDKNTDGNTDTSMASENKKKSKSDEDIIDILPYPRYLRVNVSIIGEYPEILTFLHRMETLPFALDVVGLEFRERNVEEAVSAPSVGPGQNPFLIFGQSAPEATSVAAVQVSPDKEVIPGSLEATFDTVIYVSK